MVKLRHIARIIAYGTVGFIIAALSGALFSGHSLQALDLRPQTVQAGVPTPEPVRSADFGAWSYKAGRNDKGILEATVVYDSNSAKGLRAYAAANRAAAAQIAALGGPVEIQVVFREPLGLEEYRAWASALGLAADTVGLRTLDAAGQRSTLSLFPRGKEPLPQAALDTQLAGANKAAGPLTVRGVFAVRGTVAATRLPEVLADKRIFLPDITAAFIKRDLATSGVADAAQVRVTVFQPYWQMEDLGLDSFR